ncbi:hypothetical protein CHUAL_010798 [Chamberlinius hualienensis]
MWIVYVILSLVLVFNFPVCSALNIFNPINTEYDFIVVGGGSAGSVLAGRLSENSQINVLLIEAGSFPPLLTEIPAAASIMVKSNIDWHFQVAPSKNACLLYDNQQCNYVQGKVLGGGSTINQMVYVRGNRRDYDTWESLGNEGWSWKDVLPYFLKAEGNTISDFANDKVYHNSDGPLTVSQTHFKTLSLEGFLDSGVENGYTIGDCNGDVQSVFMQYPLTRRNGARCSSYKAYLNSNLNRNNLIIATNAVAIKILFDDTKRATGVVFRQYDIEHTVTASKEVLLSAGAINSPALLMLSGVGPADHLNQLNIPIVADLQGVGQNLHNHLGFAGLLWTVNCTNCTYNLMSAMAIRHMFNWLLFGEGPLEIPNTAEGMGFVSTKYVNKEEDFPDIQLNMASGNIAFMRQLVNYFLGLTRETIQQLFEPIAKLPTFYIVPFLMRPKSRGTIKLQSSNPLQQPLIDFSYLTNYDDIATLREGVKIGWRIGNSPSLKRIGATFYEKFMPGCEKFKQYSDEYWECACQHLTITAYHAAGTCKMGKSSDPLAVVDSKLKVYKVSGLRVIDASIMPLPLTGNVNAPTMMIAEKISTAIKTEHKL